MTRVIRMTEQDYAEGAENGVGVCLACGAQADGVEPDARKYQCSSCGQFAVYGLEEALLMGHVEFAEMKTIPKRVPSPSELNDRGFIHPNAGVVLHRILSVLYRDGPDTEWNSDMWQAIAGILDEAGLTYEQWTDDEEIVDS